MPCALHLFAVVCAVQHLVVAEGTGHAHIGLVAQHILGAGQLGLDRRHHQLGRAGAQADHRQTTTAPANLLRIERRGGYGDGQAVLLDHLRTGQRLLRPLADADTCRHLPGQSAGSRPVRGPPRARRFRPSPVRSPAGRPATPGRCSPPPAPHARAAPVRAGSRPPPPAPNAGGSAVHRGWPGAPCSPRARSGVRRRPGSVGPGPAKAPRLRCAAVRRPAGRRRNACPAPGRPGRNRAAG